MSITARVLKYARRKVAASNKRDGNNEKVTGYNLKTRTLTIEKVVVSYPHVDHIVVDFRTGEIMKIDATPAFGTKFVSKKAVPYEQS